MNTIPSFSISIPTFNRVNLLRESLDAATQQTLAGIEVIVSDNASTDSTKELMEGSYSTVIYSRNETNIGASANFKRAFELSHGTIFSWLQDDDMIHQDFARRALEAFQKRPNLKAYVAYAVHSPDSSGQANAQLVGPPFFLDWFRKGGVLEIPGSVVTPISLFVTVGFSPSAAFEAAALKQALHYLDKNYYLLVERVILAKVAAHGPIAIDPFVGALFRFHPEQLSKIVWRDQDIEMSQWAELMKDLTAIADEIGPRWKDDFAGILPIVPTHEKAKWLRSTKAWPVRNKFCDEVLLILRKSMPEKLLGEIDRESRKKSVAGKMKSLVRSATPPVIWQTMARLRKSAAR